MNLSAATLDNASATSMIYFSKDGANSPRVSPHDSQATYTFQLSRPAPKIGLENPTTNGALLTSVVLRCMGFKT
jgi:hypothetical protein